MASLSDSDERPDARLVAKFHTNDDLDSDKNSHHHSIGTDVNQAASGAHNHDGSNSVLLLDGYEITGNTTDTKVNSIIAALARLGATDSTT